MKIPQPWFRASKQCWFVTLDGKQFRLGKDETKARAKYLALLAKQQGPIGPEENVRRLLDLYWGWCKAHLAESTIEVRTRHLQSFWHFIEPDLTISEFRPLHVQAWISGEYPKSGPTYKNVLITVIKGATSWAVRMGYIDVDPIAKMKKPRANVRQEFVPFVDWPSLISCVASQPRRDFLTFMLATGARVQETRKLEARHIEGNRFVLPIKESKGGRRSRVIYLPPQAAEITSRLAAEYPLGALFRTTRGVAWNKNSINCLMRHVKRKLGIEKLSATGLRHSFAHARLTAGQDSAVVAALMGHVSTRMVTERYGHLSANVEFLAAEANRLTIPQARASEGSPQPVA
ncbi:MAG TPA: tyrosine-type recombinase/integrase [Lacipirellulaceae bacterium]|jgi:integrase